MGLGNFFRSYTAGVTTGDLRRLFDSDAGRAFRVLTREHRGADEPTGAWARFLYRTKLLFLGISYKLEPSRRLLFAVAIIALLLSVIELRWVGGDGAVTVQINTFWSLLAGAALLYLLALELVDRVLVRDELEVARQLQRDLLPRQAPPMPGYTTAHSFQTANEIGGDYYDFLTLPDGRVVLIIGDASGHGMAAGLLMAIAAAVLRLATELDPSPRKIAELVNRALCRTGDRHAFMSLFCAVLDPATGALDYVCAGHPFPMLRRGDRTIIELGDGGLPLGIHEPVAVSSGAIELAPGEVLLLYTDGLPETVDAVGRAYGFERLAAHLRAETMPQRLHNVILRDLDAHRGTGPLLDDLSLVVIRRDAVPTTDA